MTSIPGLQNKAIIMGILNVTPDSFSDGGQFVNPTTAIHQVKKMLSDGAGIIDIGGESTRPGAQDVSAEEELDRVIPVVKAIREFSDCLISIDTSKAIVMRETILAGANIINDVRALQEEHALETAADLDVPVCLMHMQGQPRSMQTQPNYSDVVSEVKQFLQRRIEMCLDGGIKKENIIIDPGFGFGKSLEHNLALFNALDEFVEMNYPVLVGVSRKSMIGQIVKDNSSDESVHERVYASVVMAGLAAQHGVKIIRVHDVKATADSIAVVNSLK